MVWQIICKYFVRMLNCFDLYHISWHKLVIAMMATTRLCLFVRLDTDNDDNDIYDIPNRRTGT